MHILRIDSRSCGSAEILTGIHATVMAHAQVVQRSVEVLTLGRVVAGVAVLLVAALAINATTASADPIEKQNRSAFEYQDGQAPEKRPYRKPKLDVDPTDLSIEEMRSRLNYLEERIERLEQIVQRSEGARR